MNNKNSKLGLGLVIGSVLGGLAAFFLSPKTGKENREMVSRKIHELKLKIEEQKIQERVKEIYGDVTEEGTRMYTMARDEINTRLDELKKTMDEIDIDKYKAMVNDVIERIKSETQTSAEHLAKLRDYFMDKWGEAKTEAEDDVEKVAKGAKKVVKG